jgi:hypothetical protein
VHLDLYSTGICSKLRYDNDMMRSQFSTGMFRIIGDEVQPKIAVEFIFTFQANLSVGRYLKLGKSLHSYFVTS